jgi:hypothetical protein
VGARVEGEVSDLADKAQAVLEVALEAARTHRKPTLPFTGKCYNCEEPIEDGRFCDADCREDWTRRTRRAY